MIASGSTLLVDASVYIFRYYFALPARWQSRTGMDTEAVQGFTGFLLDLIETRPARLACAFDESLGSCFRNELYPDYKCSRVLPDEALAFQLAACHSMAETLGIACYAHDRYEADDLLASLTRTCASEGPLVVSRDKDLAQLLASGAAGIWDAAANEIHDTASTRARFGVAPEQIPDYLALVGDSIDDIPGVPGVGAKTAARLLGHFPDVESLIAGVAEVAGLPLRGAAGIAARLEAHSEQIRMAKALATLAADAPAATRADDLAWHSPGADLPIAFAAELGLSPAVQARMERLL
ncbi:5'-3' exonuclease [Biformimicrobium ophioploci]|uniref:5'-3' exonuclease H3TH domain-containing protein n=1 Tax=Biformimicrobium ophioploci TaxID=3036711 RepID=A0ABQ6LY82_9GAMM|nr:5'-3' exonuclease H3TH domain-containing protein [Microbulbifer sp. NKW57]GMG87005.1 5'-3' exonuclease H3TH domain-containing protein [Microbulbifer sp. NKW57]